MDNKHKKNLKIQYKKPIKEETQSSIINKKVDDIIKDTSQFTKAARERDKVLSSNLQLIVIALVSSIVLFIVVMVAVFTPNSFISGNYDYYVTGLTENQVTDLKAKSFVDGLFSFSLTYVNYDSEHYHKGDSQSKIAIMAAPSFDYIDYSSFAPENRLVGDSRILMDKARNPVVIDEELSIAENLKLGDSFTIYGDFFTGKQKNLTVGGIYRKHNEFARFDIIMLVNDETNSELFSSLGSNAGYTHAYVSCNNKKSMDAFLKNEFFPHLYFGNLEAFHYELEPKQRRRYYQTKRSHMRDAWG